MQAIFTDEYFMRIAIQEAKKALEQDEIPVGAIIVSNNKILAKAHNQTQLLHDITAHAEIMAITTASQFLGAKYLKECILYVTLEPCVMCAGALYWSQIQRVVYAAEDPKKGFMRYGKSLLHPKTTVEFGILQDECSQLITQFFKTKRSKTA